MKKTLGLVLMALLLLAGCGQATASAPLYAAPGGSASSASSNPHAGVELPMQTGDILDIPEKLFIAQTNDIYYNADDYLGRTIRYEGMYKNSAEWAKAGDETLHYVIRYGPGCCGYDANAGFEVAWDGGYPEADDWVEVVGVLEQYEEDGYEYLRLNLSSLKVLETRGAEYVYQ